MGVSAAADQAYLRVGVTVSGFSVDGPVVVYRVHEDGTRWAVRGVSDVSGGSAFGYDYETPLNAPVTYEVTDGAVLTSSATVTVSAGGATLTIPGVPSMGGPVLVVGKPQLGRSRPSTTLEVFGRATPIVLSDTLKAPAGKLVVRTRTDTEAYQLTATLQLGSVFLLRVPGSRVTDWAYVMVGDVAEDPMVGYGSANMPPGSVAEWSDWTLQVQVVSPPVGGMFGDPTASYQSRVDTGATYQDAVNSGRTYLDRLRGV